MMKFPWMSPYVAFDNNPVYFIDPYGLESGTGSSDGEPEKKGDTYTDDNGIERTLTQGQVEVFANKDPMKHTTGNVYADSKDHDLSKKPIPGVGLNKMDELAINDPTNPNHVLKYFELCFGNACSAGMNDAFGFRQAEGFRLFNNFVLGEHKEISFGTNTYASKDASENPSFIEMADKFERSAIAHFKEHGNLNQFNGERILRNNKPYFNNTWYIHTIMGGIAQVTAKINKINASEISVTYYLWDHFGAGSDDAKTNLPGLSAMYHLQHNFSEGENGKFFNPFIWHIKIER
jgi:hypothetical protein